MSFVNNKYYLFENQNSLKRLIILPHAGGNALLYLKLGELFSKEYEVLILQYPGRLNRVSERNLASIENYAQELRNLLSTIPEKNTVIFGHSMGGLIAYDYAINASDECHRVNKYVISSFNFRDKLYKQRISENEALQLLSITDQNLMDKLICDENHQLNDIILPPLINDLNAVSVYTDPFLTIDKDIVVIFGSNDKSVSRKNMEEWKYYSKGKIELIELSGGHFYFQGNEEIVFDRITKSVAMNSL